MLIKQVKINDLKGLFVYLKGLFVYLKGLFVYLKKKIDDPTKKEKRRANVITLNLCENDNENGEKLNG